MSDKSLIGRKVRKPISKSERCEFNLQFLDFFFFYIPERSFPTEPGSGGL